MQTKKTSLRKLAVVFSVVLAGTYSLVLACGWDGDYEWPSNFAPEAFVKASYSPLFYEPNFIFYGEDDLADKKSRFNEEIIDDWSTYFKGKVKAEQLSLLLIHDSSTSLVNELHAAITRKQIPKNANGLNVKDPSVVSAIEFLWNAKIVERYSDREQYSWDYQETQKTNADPLVPTIKRMEKLYNESKDSFLKNRYWFQIMKAHFYSQHPENMIPFYEQTQSTTPKNTLYYRALGYLAGAYYYKRDFYHSNYLYSVTFDKCEQLRSDAGFGFHPVEGADMDATLALTQTVDEKCAVWALWGYYLDEEKAIGEIYKLNPASSHLDFLLTRLVNKFEYGNENFEASKSRAFVESIAREGKVSNRFLWNSAAGYLNIFDNDSTTAGRFFKEAGKYCPEDVLAREQLRLLKTVNLIAGVKKIDRATEKKLLNAYQDLNAHTGSVRKELAFKWASNHLSFIYTSVHHNPVFAELFKHDPKFFGKEENCEALKAFLLKPDKSDWEKFAASISPVTVEQIHEFQSIQSALTQNLDRAISMMEKAGPAGNVELYGNPFNGKIKDCHDCDHLAPQKVKYSKLAYLRKMKEMENNVTAGNDVYNNASLLANAYYNMTYYGNARVFYGSPIYSELHGSADQPSDCSPARKYYTIAFNASANDEQRAKCTYMLAKCERNDYYTSLYGTDYQYGSDNPDFKAWEGFVTLKTKYAHTRYYKEVISECGYFKSYLGLEDK